MGDHAETGPKQIESQEGSRTGSKRVAVRRVWDDLSRQRAEENGQEDRQTARGEDRVLCNFPSLAAVLLLGSLLLPRSYTAFLLLLLLCLYLYLHLTGALYLRLSIFLSREGAAIR